MYQWAVSTLFSECPPPIFPVVIPGDEHIASLPSDLLETCRPVTKMYQRAVSTLFSECQPPIFPVVIPGDEHIASLPYDLLETCRPVTKMYQWAVSTLFSECQPPIFPVVLSNHGNLADLATDHPEAKKHVAATVATAAAATELMRGGRGAAAIHGDSKMIGPWLLG